MLGPEHGLVWSISVETYAANYQDSWATAASSQVTPPKQVGDSRDYKGEEHAGV